MPHAMSKFEPDERAPEIFLEDRVLPVQKDWEDGKKYVVILTLEQQSRNSEKEFGGPRNHYRIVKAESPGTVDKFQKMKRAASDMV